MYRFEIFGLAHPGIKPGPSKHGSIIALPRACWQLSQAYYSARGSRIRVQPSPDN